MDRVRFIHNHRVPEIPNVLDNIHRQLFNGLKEKQLDIIKERSTAYGYEYHPERIVCVVDSAKNELYYYQTDYGGLQPIIALTPMEVSNRDADNSIIVTLGCRELHMDIFKPIT